MEERWERVNVHCDGSCEVMGDGTMWEKTLGHLQIGEVPAAMSDHSGDPMMGSGSPIGQQWG